jgi:prophage regulatory protein
MRMISMNDLKPMKGICYSRVHLHRLIKKGEFVQPVALGKGRIAFIEAEVDEWLKQKAANRPAQRDATIAA